MFYKNKTNYYISSLYCLFGTNSHSINSQLLNPFFFSSAVSKRVCRLIECKVVFILLSEYGRRVCSWSSLSNLGRLCNALGISSDVNSICRKNTSDFTSVFWVFISQCHLYLSGTRWVPRHSAYSYKLKNTDIKMKLVSFNKKWNVCFP